MRKITALFLVLLCVISLVSCYNTPPALTLDYTGKPLGSIYYRTVEYIGGYTEEYKVDFAENTVLLRTYLPTQDDMTDFRPISTFTEAQERELINRLYTYGMFDIDAEYPSPPDIVDGGEWLLRITFLDYTQLTSSGVNNSPREVFGECAKAFYSLCGHGIVSNVPESYYTPPNLSYSFGTETDSMDFYTYGARLSYKWNGFTGDALSAYELNESTDFGMSFREGEEIELKLFTANWRDTERFERYTLTSYDYTPALTGAEQVKSGRWFSDVTIPLEPDKIYVLRLDFDDGDYVEYTFNTRT